MELVVVEVPADVVLGHYDVDRWMWNWMIVQWEVVLLRDGRKHESEETSSEAWLRNYRV